MYHESKGDASVKIIKKSIPIILWILLIALSSVILSNTASKMGEYSTEAWRYVKGLFAHSTMFWAIGILIIIQVVLMNLKPFKYKTVLVIILAVIVVIVSIAFYQDLSRTMTTYKQIILDTDGIPEVGIAISGYIKYVFIYTIISIILSIINIIFELSDKIHSKK